MYSKFDWIWKELHVENFSYKLIYTHDNNKFVYYIFSVAAGFHIWFQCELN